MESSNNLTINELQGKVDTWIKEHGVRYFSELTNLAILTEEVGELARLMSRKYGDQSFKDNESAKNIDDELADVLWVVVCLANQMDIDLEKALENNFLKKTKRDSARHKENKKLNP